MLRSGCDDGDGTRAPVAILTQRCHATGSGGVVAGDVICAVSVSYQAAAIDNRTCANAKASWNGHADAMATLIRRTLIRTRAPIFSSLRRMVPQVASANC